MTFNNEQAKYISEIIKIVAIAQFGYFGYKSLETPDHAIFYISGVVFIALSAIGTLILGLIKEERK